MGDPPRKDHSSDSNTPRASPLAPSAPPHASPPTHPAGQHGTDPRLGEHLSSLCRVNCPRRHAQAYRYRGMPCSECSTGPSAVFRQLGPRKPLHWQCPAPHAFLYAERTRGPVLLPACLLATTRPSPCLRFLRSGHSYTPRTTAARHRGTAGTGRCGSRAAGGCVRAHDPVGCPGIAAQTFPTARGTCTCSLRSPLRRPCRG